MEEFNTPDPAYLIENTMLAKTEEVLGDGDAAKLGRYLVSRVMRNWREESLRIPDEYEQLYQSESEHFDFDG